MTVGCGPGSRRSWWRVAADIEDQTSRPVAPTRRGSTRPSREAPVLEATGRGPVWSWDIRADHRRLGRGRVRGSCVRRCVGCRGDAPAWCAARSAARCFSSSVRCFGTPSTNTPASPCSHPTRSTTAPGDKPGRDASRPIALGKAIGLLRQMSEQEPDAPQPKTDPSGSSTPRTPSSES